ncbi:DUF72 domain-containing protein [Paenibacillus sp. GCM10023248]|uniref:DUF72 domain-containing protein n=1 Tax=Bacillales TaxID=1385 RepID=UPI0023781BB8|nr:MULTISPECIES: DUF72 domain-containing protein [Bacillales]MDD9270653.1 DUF72 domain-containing protein [Paenibacillus sp. MAHUQ-63]MDR6884676.1 uncharacterized protein YecE (DUF72 family) [Bacillus sp. 3255]
MITIGLAGWGDHDDLYEIGTKPQDKLKVYNKYFSVVEVDSSYYAIHKESLFSKWAMDTSNEFTFLIKAYQGLTGHTRQPYTAEETDAMFHSFIESIEPVIRAGKLKAVLFQYPPWFDCNRDNVHLLRLTKERMGDIPVALEFRHQSWFSSEMKEKTLSFMMKEGWIHSICDEPQVFPGSVPTVLTPTNKTLTVVRFHGRNVSGWTSSSNANWREVRYLYRYNDEELLEWKKQLLKLEEETDEVCVIFNNNSGGDAASNAMRLSDLLGFEQKHLPPEQLDMFE